MQPYQSLLERIASVSGLSLDDIERKVEAKKAKLSGLISREGAAQIIAAELGVNFDDQQVKIADIVPNMRKVHVIGKIVQLFPVREYEKNGRSGKVLNIRLADETGSCRVVFWDTNHIALFESGELREGNSVEISNASTRDTEIHVAGFSEVKKSDVVLSEVKLEQPRVDVTIDALANGQSVRVRGVVVQLFPIRFYSVCPECNKKAIVEGESFMCAEHGDIAPKKRGIVNLVLDDGTETVRVVLFSDAINMLTSEDELLEPAQFEAFRADILGTEVYVAGSVRKNTLFQNLELIVQNIERVDVEALAKELEAV